MIPPLPAAIGIVLNENHSEVLLIKRKDVPVWVLPGGGIELGELPDKALTREVKEETGIVVAIMRQCAEYTPLNRLASHTSVFLCQASSGDENNLVLSEESSDAGFFPINALPLNFFHLHARWLKECLNTPNLIRRPLKEVSYLALCKYLILHPWQVFRFAWTRFTKQ